MKSLSQVAMLFSVPSAIQFVRVISTDDRSAMLQWTEPTYSGLHIIEYQIRYSKAQTVFTVKTKETLFKLQQLEPYTSYMVQVGFYHATKL